MSQRGENNPNYKNRREKAHRWNGGRKINAAGYVMLHMPEHPMATRYGYVLEHRYVVSQHLGRPLTRSEVVHHKDGNKQNNAIENLELITQSQHALMHLKDGTLNRDETTGRLLRGNG